MDSFLRGRVGFERGGVGADLAECDDVGAMRLACQRVNVVGAVAGRVDLHAVGIVGRVGGEGGAKGEGALEVAEEVELLEVVAFVRGFTLGEEEGEDLHGVVAEWVNMDELAVDCPELGRCCG